MFLKRFSPNDYFWSLYAHENNRNCQYKTIWTDKKYKTLSFFIYSESDRAHQQKSLVHPYSHRSYPWNRLTRIFQHQFRDPKLIIPSKLKKYSHHVFWIWVETPPKVYFFVGNFFNISDASKSWLPFFSTIPRISKTRIDFSTLAVYSLRVMKKHICMLNEESPTWQGFGVVWCIGVQLVAIPCGKIMISRQSKSEIFCLIIIFLSFFNSSHELSLY